MTQLAARNLTGVSILSTELDSKRQESLIDSVPGLTRMAALADTNATAAWRLSRTSQAAQVLYLSGEFFLDF